MKMRCDLKTLLRAALGVFAITALTTCIAPTLADTVLFSDSFSYPTPGTTPAPPDPGYVSDLNSQIDYAGRQSGSLVASGGPIAYTQSNHGGGMVLGYSALKTASPK